MIIIRLAGGFGNQLFQFGAGLLLAKKSGIKKILIDDGALNNYDAKRQNELLNFINLKGISLDIKFKHLNITKFRLPRLAPLNFSKFPLVSDKNFQKIIKSPNNFFALLDGYFQWELSQDDFNEIIVLLGEFLVNQDMKINHDCVIHIRGGDFVNLGWNSVASREYYLKSVETMRNEYKQDKFYIITDDREYSKTILDRLDIDCEFIGKSMHEDFRLIGSFKYRILSSSTFALWASAFGDNEKSFVIAPKYWTPGNERKIRLTNELETEL